MKKSKVRLSAFIIFALVLLSFVSIANAASLLPQSIMDLMGLLGPGGVCASTYIESRIQFILILALGGIVLVAVAYALIAAFKYIRSEGVEGKMEEAKKTITSIFIGIAAMMVAIVGIVLVFAIFGARQANPELLQTCINAPLSAACADCRISGSGGATSKCAICENAISVFCKSADMQTSGNLDWAGIQAKLNPQDACK